MRTVVFTLLASSALVLGGCPEDGKDGPQGDPGAKGDTGPIGETGDPGTVGATGATGPKGDTGATGPKGDTGVAGPKGDTGADGADASCADAEKLVITGVTGVPDLAYVGDAIDITVGLEGGSGGAVDDADIVILGDIGPDFMPGATFDAFSATPEMPGQFGYIVMATDGCSVAVSAFEVEAAVFEAQVSFVHLVTGAPSPVTIAPTGETSGTSAYFGDRTSWVEVGMPMMGWDILDPADDSVLVQIPEQTFEYLSEQFLVAYPDGSDGVAFANVPAPMTPPTTDTWSLQVFNGTTADIKFFADDNTTVVFDTVAPGAMSAETNEYAEETLEWGVDVDGDDEKDLVVTFSSSSQYAGRNYIAYAYDAGGTVKLVFVSYDPDDGSILDYTPTVIDLNTVHLSLVHVAPNADGTLKLARGGAVLRTVSFENTSDFFAAPSGGAFDVLDSLDNVVMTLDLDMAKQTRQALVFFEDAGVLQATTFEENDDPLATDTSRIGFFNGADGISSVSVLADDNSTIFGDVAFGTNAGTTIEIATADTDLYLDTDGDDASDHVFTLPQGASGGEVFRNESGTAFFYMTATAKPRVLYRSFTSNTTSTTGYEGVHSVSKYPPPTLDPGATIDQLYPTGTLNSAASLGLAVVDGTGSRDTINVPSSCTIVNISVGIDITHEYRGDVQLELTAPDGTSIVLWDGSGGSAVDLVGTFGGPSQDLTPEESLAAFAGVDAMGDWELYAWDNFASGDDGTLNGWSVNFACE